MITERLLVLALIGAGVATVWVALRWHIARLRRVNARDVQAHLGARNVPLVVAFTTPECVPCRTMQRPALEELQRRHPGSVAVREVDAAVSPDLADRFAIMTVPSTVVIDRGGRVLAINYGVARWEKLAAQLRLTGPGAGRPVEAAGVGGLQAQTPVRGGSAASPP